MSRTNFTAEDTALTREHIQTFINSKNKSDKVKLSNDLKTELKNKGHKDDNIDKVLGDLDSYL